MTNKICAIYTRTACDTMQRDGVAKQGSVCREFIAQHDNWTLVEKEYCDSGISGFELNKPALNRLLQDAKTGKIDVIVMINLARLHRDDFFRGFNYADLFIHKFRQQGTKIICVENHELAGDSAAEAERLRPFDKSE